MNSGTGNLIGSVSNKHRTTLLDARPSTKLGPTPSKARARPKQAKPKRESKASRRAPLVGCEHLLGLGSARARAWRPSWAAAPACVFVLAYETLIG